MGKSWDIHGFTLRCHPIRMDPPNPPEKTDRLGSSAATAQHLGHALRIKAGSGCFDALRMDGWIMWFNTYIYSYICNIYIINISIVIYIYTYISIYIYTWFYSFQSLLFGCYTVVQLFAPPDQGSVRHRSQDLRDMTTWPRFLNMAGWTIPNL